MRIKFIENDLLEMSNILKRETGLTRIMTI